MSELRRGWWKEPEYDPGRSYCGFSLSPDQMRHVQEAFEFVENADADYFCHADRDARRCLLSRGTPPEPEWLPVGVAPDREGVWERKYIVQQAITVTRNDDDRLLMQSGHGMAWYVDEIDHGRHRYRRIGDL